MPTISSSIHNQVHNTLFDLMGTTATGYGAVLLGDPVAPGQPVAAENWNNLLGDIERCLIHQNGTSTHNISIAAPGEVIKFATPARMFTALQVLQQNIGRVDPSQTDSFTYNTNAVSPLSWTCTNYSSTATMIRGQGYMSTINWSWFYENQLYYFFNLGGSLEPVVRIEQDLNDERSKWIGLVNAVNDYVLFTREEFLLALENPEKTYTFVITGEGVSSHKTKTLVNSKSNYVKHIAYKYKLIENYTANAIIVTFRVDGSTIIGSLNFVAGLGKTKKKKSNDPSFIGVSIQLNTDFRTTYTTGANGGIATQIPQTQIISNSLSAYPAPIPQFTVDIGSSTEPQTITLRNNSTFTCVVEDIVLSGYTTGTVTPSSFSIDPNSSRDVELRYTGFAPGHFNGLVDVLCNVNRLTLFTEINVGSTNPTAIEITTSTYDVISRDFVVNHAGGYFKGFGVEFEEVDGFTYTPHVSGSVDTFNMTFSPRGLVNGTYSSTAQVSVNPMDSSRATTVFHTPMTVHVNVYNAHIADWTSCILGSDSRLGFSYDVLSGRTYLTIGIGSNNPSMTELRTEITSFNSWTEVYRILLEDTTRTVHSKDWLVKSDSEFKYEDYFGVGSATGSIFIVKYDGLGNLAIDMSTLNIVPDQNKTETQDLSTAFRYYDSSRAHQLQELSSLTQGGQTYFFMGFDRYGETQYSLVSPN